MTHNIHRTAFIITLLLGSQYFITATGMTQEPQPPLPVTELMNDASKELDSLSAENIAALMNNEDKKVADAVTPCIPLIGKAIDKIVDAFRGGGRFIYIGAGTSGRLGVLDASECYPTFSAEPGQVVGLIAGGDRALRTSIEGAEDNGVAGVDDLKNIELTTTDVVCGISTSGKAAYVAEALRYAKSLGCYTIFMGCTPEAPIGKEVDCFIAAIVGPEVLTGSTRLKSGTVTKMVLNMLTTGAFVRYGKVYRNLMVDVRPVNKKLVDRCHRIIAEVCKIEKTRAIELFEQAGNDVKTAILLHELGLEVEELRELLRKNKGLLRQTIEYAQRNKV